MAEILQLVEQLNQREQEGATIAEIRERKRLILQLAPGWDVVYIKWRGIDSWVLVPMSTMPEWMRRIDEELVKQGESK